MTDLRYYMTKGERSSTRAQQIWIILTAHVQAVKAFNIDSPLITYGDVCERMGISRNAGRTIALPLGMVGHLCLQHRLPALNTIVINAESGIPGHGVVTTSGKTLKHEQKAVKNYNWFGIQPPSPRAFREIYEGWSK